MQKGICKSCGANIFWLKYKDKVHPVDAKSKRVFVFINDQDKWFLKTGYESHFSSCPHSNKWRQRKEKQMDQDQEQPTIDKPTLSEGSPNQVPGAEAASQPEATEPVNPTPEADVPAEDPSPAAPPADSNEESVPKDETDAPPSEPNCGCAA